MPLVFDASALKTYLHGEPGWEIVENLIARRGECHIHAVNFSEVYAHCLSSSIEKDEAWRICIELKLAGIVVHGEILAVDCRHVGELNAAYDALIPDCFAAVLASQLRAELVTVNHQSFDSMAADNVCRVRFIH
jgi:PIN domain nuclease of toxin-antitoxin system